MEYILYIYTYILVYSKYILYSMYISTSMDSTNVDQYWRDGIVAGIIPSSSMIPEIIHKSFMMYFGNEQMNHFEICWSIDFHDLQMNSQKYFEAFIFDDSLDQQLRTIDHIKTSQVWVTFLHLNGPCGPLVVPVVPVVWGTQMGTPHSDTHGQLPWSSFHPDHPSSCESWLVGTWSCGFKTW
jgi:hypothetical protein